MALTHILKTSIYSGSCVGTGMRRAGPAGSRRRSLCSLSPPADMSWDLGNESKDRGKPEQPQLAMADGSQKPTQPLSEGTPTPKALGGYPGINPWVGNPPGGDEGCRGCPPRGKRWELQPAGPSDTTGHGLPGE